MNNTNPIVVVAGATGRTGRLIVKELLGRDFVVRALTGRPAGPENTSGLRGPNIEIVFGDLGSVESLGKVMSGADYLISALGSRKIFSKKEFEKVDVVANRNLAEAAKAAGVKQMVVISSIGAGDSREAISCFFRGLMGRVLEGKTRMEAAIKAVGLDYTIIRPGGFSNKPLSGEIALGEGGKIGGMVQREQIAKFCVDVISNPATKNRTFEVVDLAKVKPERRQFVIKL